MLCRYVTLVKIVLPFLIKFLCFVQIKCFSFQELSTVNLTNCLQNEKAASYLAWKTNCTFKDINQNLSCIFEQNSVDIISEERANSESSRTFEIWMYSLGSAFFISLAGIWGYILLPLLTGSLHDHVMNILVGLSFGSLITSALCQLIPEAYELSKHSPKYIHIAVFSMVGLWISALIQSLSTIIGKEDVEQAFELEPMNKVNNHKKHEKSAEGRPLNNFSSENQNNKSSNRDLKKLNSDSDIINNSAFHRPTSYTSIRIKPKLSKLAIIILAGDCVNNFMDGISIGAGYSHQLSTGIKLSAAIAFEEYTHKLGDFAIVYQSGISMKRVLFWNYTTSCACFVGIVIGIALGSLNWSQYIFAFASGLFLYISLSNMIPEMQNMLEDSLSKSKSSALITLLEQHVGFFLAFVVLIVISIVSNEHGATSPLR